MSYPTEIDPRSQARDFLALLIEREKRVSIRAAEIAAGVDAGNTSINKAWVLEKLRENAINGMQQKGGSSIANRALELIGIFCGKSVRCSMEQDAGPERQQLSRPDKR